jgi:hypothetical protein
VANLEEMKEVPDVEAWVAERVDDDNVAIHTLELGIRLARPRREIPDMMILTSSLTTGSCHCRSPPRVILQS